MRREVTFMDKTMLNIKIMYDKMGKAEKRIADWLMENPGGIIPLSIIDLAEKCNVSRQAIAKWEKGETTPDVYTLVKIAQHYNVSLNYLLGIDTENYNKKEVLDYLIDDFIGLRTAQNQLF